MLYFVLRQTSHITLCLADCSINSILVAARCKFFAGLLAFEDKAVTPIQVYVAFFRGRVSALRCDEALEDIGVLSRVTISRLRARKAQQVTKIPHKRLEV